MRETFKAYETPTGPQLEVLGQAESALPAPMKRRGTARAAALALALVSVLLVGGLKLKGQYGSVQQMYESGRDADGYAYNISACLQTSQDTAANILTVAGQILDGTDATLQNAQQALEALEESRETGGPSAQYQANSALKQSVDLLYQNLQLGREEAGADGGLYDSLQTQWSAFLDSQDQMSHIADDPRIEGQKSYNEAAREYNQTVSSLPARWLAALWGCQEVELFA